MEINLRELKKEDMSVLENIICETWHYEEFSSPKTAKKLARVFFYSCLTNQTFSRVALVDGLPVGVILGKDVSTHKCTLRDRFRQIGAILSLYASKEGRNVSKVFSNVSDIDKQLLKDRGFSYPGELSLFAISSSCRGKGIGKLLYQSFLEYMKQQNISQFFLFTDTSCNYGFYEHQGMKQRDRKEATFHVKGKVAHMSFFLYDYEISIPSAKY